jgi:hypothetical protein
MAQKDKCYDCKHHSLPTSASKWKGKWSCSCTYGGGEKEIINCMIESCDNFSKIYIHLKGN